MNETEIHEGGWEEFFDVRRTSRNIESHYPRYSHFYRALVIAVHGPYEPTLVPVPVTFHVRGEHGIDDLDTAIWVGTPQVELHVCDLSRHRTYFDRFPGDNQLLPEPFTIYWADQRENGEPRNRVISTLWGAHIRGNVLVVKNRGRDIAVHAHQSDIPIVSRLLQQ
ncbi:hypothetical protein FPV67DRAFT_1675334 [Lyophyllum atratum]|nr:hypothetical protein FPV67DRAFT_1675334 [Lyophyllum atratum]